MVANVAQKYQQFIQAVMNVEPLERRRELSYYAGRIDAEADHA